MAACEKCGNPLTDRDIYCPNCGTPVPGRAAPSGSQQPPPSTGPAQAEAPRSGLDALTRSQEAQDYWVRRLVALFIDGVIVYLALGILSALVIAPAFIASILSGGVFSPGAWWGFMSFPFAAGLIMIIYFAVSESYWGATLGKSIMGLRVATVSGGRPSLGQTFLRNLSKLHWLLLLLDTIVGLAVQAEYRQKFSDRYAGTIVMKR
jgi:uncharacterized RDD family membrane protein YckC